MSLYNMMNGMNASGAVVFSPFLPIRADKFPRFRDIFTSDEEAPTKGDLYIYTRMGGGNAECWENGDDDCNCPACCAAKLEDLPECIAAYDDDFDCTYKTFVFKVPDVMRADFDLVMAEKIKETSDAYKARLKELFADSKKISEWIRGIA